MTAVHGAHNSIYFSGIADDCERCAVIAVDPFGELDDGNLVAIIERTLAWMKDDEFPRSKAETIAMRHVEATLVRVRHMERIGLLEWLGMTA